MLKDHNYRQSKVETLLQIELYSEQIFSFDPYVWISVKPYYFTRTDDTSAKSVLGGIDFLPNNFCNGYHLDGLVYSAGTPQKSFENYAGYSTDLSMWSLTYKDVHSVKEHEARKMLKTLTSVNKKLKKAEEKIGRCIIPTHWIMGLASALKVSTLLFQAPESFCADKNGWVECKSNRFDEIELMIHEKFIGFKNTCKSGDQ